MVNDPIADMIIQIKNASMAGKAAVDLPSSRMKHEVAKLLVREGYIKNVEVAGEKPKERLVIHIQYHGDQPAITKIVKKSKPGLRVYVGTKQIPRVVGGLGTAILSTPMGIMTGKDARKHHVGGELLCEVW